MLPCSQQELRHKYVTASQVVKALQANIREEHRCFLQLVAASVQGVSPALAALVLGLSTVLPAAGGCLRSEELALACLYPFSR